MSLETEIWRDIPMFLGYYQASNLGRIRTLKRSVIRNPKNRKVHYKYVPGRIRKLSVHTSGYLRISLSKNGKVRFYYVHVLVALAFLGDKPKGFDVDHKNENKQDNRLDNLRYLEMSINRAHYGNQHARKSTTKQNSEFKAVA